MQARLKPLQGKYYGTIVEILDGPAKGHEVKFWFATGIPSDRELETWGFTRANWDNNATNYDGTPIREFICDSHYECELSLKAAEAFIESIKNL